MRKIKTVDNEGKVVVTKSEERFPYASDVLMKYGFGIVFLNMSLGLLPITIWGSRMKYFKCSISQLYTTMFCLCFIVLSAIFVPVVFFPKPSQEKSMTNIVILVAMGTSHVLGYIVLLIRGHFVARKIPIMWTQLCKMVQISVIDVYGKDCHLFKEVKSFGKWAVTEFIVIVSLSMGSLFMFSEAYGKAYEESFSFYGLKLFWPLHGNLTQYDEFQLSTYHIAYFLWQSCSYAHVLVSMLLCFIVIMITTCLKSVNQQIFDFKEDNGCNREGGIRIPKIHFKRSRLVNTFNTEGILEHEMTNMEYDCITQKLVLIKKTMIIIEEVLFTASHVWGISLVVEALVLIASGTASTFDFFATFQQSGGELQGGSDPSSIISFNLPQVDQWLQLMVTVSIHFFFLFKLACSVNKMIAEANESIRLLKQASFYHLPQSIQQKIQDLKQDLATTTISLTASNYFQINKFLITSITSQIATYVIVLLQFAQQESTTASDGGSNTKKIRAQEGTTETIRT